MQNADGRDADDIHVACCFDDRMSIPALMLAYSVRQTGNKTRRTIFHAVATEAVHLPTNINEMLNTDYFDFRLHHVDIGMFDAIDMSHSFISSRTTLCRILLPRIITEARKLIYMDCDVIANKALDDLFDMPMNDCTIAACIEYWMFINISSADTNVSSVHKNLVNALIPDYRPYFNAGVIVIDVDRWIAENCENRILALLDNPPTRLIYMDQDALNAIFHNDYLTLDARWNSFAPKYTPHALPPDQQREVDLARRDPWITHYSGAFKPWIDHHAATDEDWRFWTLAKQAPFYSDVVRFCKSSSEHCRREQMKLRAPIVHKRFGEFICTLAKGIAACEKTLSATHTLSKNIHIYGDMIYRLATFEPPMSKHANLPWL